MSRDTITRRVVPRLIVAASQVTAPSRAHAAMSRARGGRGRVLLFVAFDDPYSAVALLGLRDRLARRDVVLDVAPVVRRGIPDDPAVEQKRAYAVEDAARLAQRDGRTLGRDAPLAAGDVAFLAGRAAAIADDDARAAFCCAAMERLWFAGDDAVDEAAFGDLLQGVPPGDPAAVAANEARMVRRGRGPYDTPAAVIGRSWWFAHERLPSIEEHLDMLGWTAA